MVKAALISMTIFAVAVLVSATEFKSKRDDRPVLRSKITRTNKPCAELRCPPNYSCTTEWTYTDGRMMSLMPAPAVYYAQCNPLPQGICATKPCKKGLLCISLVAFCNQAPEGTPKPPICKTSHLCLPPKQWYRGSIPVVEHLMSNGNEEVL